MFEKSPFNDVPAKSRLADLRGRVANVGKKWHKNGLCRRATFNEWFSHTTQPNSFSTALNGPRFPSAFNPENFFSFKTSKDGNERKRRRKVVFPGILRRKRFLEAFFGRTAAGGDEEYAMQSKSWKISYSAPPPPVGSILFSSWAPKITYGYLDPWRVEEGGGRASSAKVIFR